MSSSRSAASAGGAIVKLMQQSSFKGLHDFEIKLIEESFNQFGESPGFAKFHLKAVRAALENWRYEDVRLLLSKDTGYNLLEDDPDIIQLAMVPRHEYMLRHGEETEKLWQQIELLIEHGAKVQTLDCYGNSPLYYSCVLGHPKTFTMLLDHGADLKTLHDSQYGGSTVQSNSKSKARESTRTLVKLPGEGDWEVSRPKLSTPLHRGMNRPKLPVPKRSGKLNLLQVALDGFVGGEDGEIWWNIDNPKLQDSWGPIIMTLIDAGLELERGDPGPVHLFQTSCYQGRLDYIRKLLDHGVDLDAGQDWGLYLEFLYGSPLHAAIMGGQKEVAHFLIDRGYRLTDRRPHRGISESAYVTPIEVAFLKYGPWANEHDRSHRRTVLDLCQSLTEFEISESDTHIIIKECVKDGHLDILQRLRHIDMTDLQIPDCDNLEIVRLLIECGAEIDPKKYQNLAISKGSLDMFKYLFERYGLCVEMDNMFASSITSLMERKNDEFLIYLLSNGLDANASLSSYGNRMRFGHVSAGETLLHMACGALDVGAVSILLRNGADPLEPRPTYTAFHVLREQTNLIPHQSVNSAHIQILQLLLAYSQNDKVYKSKALETLSAGPKELTNCLTQIAEAFEEEPEPTRTAQSRKERSRYRDLDGDEYELDPWSERDFDMDDHDYEDDDVAIDMNDGQPDDDEYGSDASVQYDEIAQPQVPVPHRAPFGGLDGQYAYQDLNGPYAIRLLMVEPATSLSAPIRCKLVRVDLSWKLQYEALSYVWGDPSEKAYILVDGFDFPVTLNLWSALCRVRLTGKPRAIWADAVCINQANIAERNQQVRIMKDIYSSTTRVLIWFGENENSSELIFEHMIRWRKWRDAYLKGNASPKYDRRGAEKPHWLPPMFSGRTREAFRTFCSRPWFFRTWTIQEQLLPKDKVIMCGPYAEQWHSINTAAEYSPKTYIRTNQKLEKAGFRFCKRDFELGAIDIIRKSPVWSGKPYTPLRGINAAAHFSTLTKLGTSIRLDRILAYSHLCQATDPKDKVYGLLALFGVEMVRVDYNLPVSEVYRAFIQSVIERRESLKILHWFGNQRTVANLPSWVPDLSSSKPCGLLPTMRFDSYEKNEDESPEYLLPGLRFRDRDLIVKGYRIAMIKTIGELLPIDPAPPPGSEAFEMVLRSWETLAAALVPSRAFKRPVTDAFLETLLAYDKSVVASGDAYRCEFDGEDDQTLRFSRNAPFFMEWYALHGTGQLRSADAGYFREYAVLQSWWTTRPDAQERADMAASFTNDMAERAYGRRLFATEDGYLGLAPPDSQPGDTIVFLPGAEYPFVARTQAYDDGAARMPGDCYLYRFDPWQACKGAYGPAVEYTFR